MNSWRKSTIALLLLGLIAQAASAEETLERICGACVPRKIASCGGFLEGISVSPTGDLWAVNVLSGGVIKVLPDGHCREEANTDGMPNGSKFLADGRLLIADKERGLLIFDTQTKTFTPVTNSYGRENFRGLNDLYSDGSGGFYVTEPYGSDVLRPTGRVFHVTWDADKVSVRLFAENIAFPNGIAVSPDRQKVYVAEFAQKRILALPSPFSTVQNPLAVKFADVPGGNGPDGLATDAKGRLYVAGYGTGDVIVFDANAEFVGRIKLPEGAGKLVTNIAFKGQMMFVTEAQNGEIWQIPFTNR